MHSLAAVGIAVRPKTEEFGDPHDTDPTDWRAKTSDPVSWRRAASQPTPRCGVRNT